MLLTQNLQFRHPGGPLLSFPDLSVGTGETLLVLGPSGCGKTTLLHLLAALLRPASGSITVGDTELEKLSPTRADRFRGQHIGMVHQQTPFVAALTVGENIRLSPFARERAAAEKLAQRLGIGELWHRMPAGLSVGERQRMAIARALVTQPRLILADEPTSALDRTHCDTVVALLQEQAAEHGAALVIVTHDERLRAQIPRTVELQAIAQNAAL